jgi:hypothetical protein
MVVGTIYPWRTSKWCSTDIYNSGAPKRHAPRICLPPFPEDRPTYIRGACNCGAPLLSSICVAHPKSMRYGYGGLTPQALMLAGAHLSVAHSLLGAPRIRRYLWSIYLGAPRLLICGAPKRGAPQIMGPWIRVFLVVINKRNKEILFFPYFLCTNKRCCGTVAVHVS